jgi:hypothetical protein
MAAPRMRRPTERPTARKMVDELLGVEEVGAVLGSGLFEKVVDEKVVDSLDVVKAEEGSAEASSLRRILIGVVQFRLIYGRKFRDNAPKIIQIDIFSIVIVLREG